MTGEELQRLRNWSDAKVTTGQEPLWTWYQNMKLREALDAIIGGMECAAIQMESSPPAREHPDSGPGLVVSNSQPGGAPKREGRVHRPNDATRSANEDALAAVLSRAAWALFLSRRAR
jgi:hypothetical protein